MKEFSEEARYEYPLGPDSVVLDCGGFEGKWSAGVFERYGCVIHVLEPVKSFFENIVARFAGVPRIKVYNWGISGESGYALFGIKADSTGQFATGGDEELVHVKGVQEVFDYLKLGKVSLAKLNVEGAEFSILEKLIETGLVSRLENIQCQFHPVAPDAETRYAAIQKKLALTHHLSFDAGWVWQSWELNG